jgi:hypothetical protein
MTWEALAGVVDIGSNTNALYLTKPVEQDDSFVFERNFP